MTPVGTKSTEGTESVRRLMSELVSSSWGDGLPMIPPFRDSVDAMIATVAAGRDDVVAILDPAHKPATVDTIAANAVMAGCLPQHFAYVLAAVEAVADARFNLNGHMCSTHTSGPMIIVGGPRSEEQGFNARGNCLGPGFQANATVGRALSLCLRNIAGATPQLVDRAIFGHPGKYTYCLAENQEASPWAPLRADMGLGEDDDAVTVYAAEAPHSMIGLCAETPFELLDIFADSMAQAGLTHYYVGGEVVLILGPAHADILAEAGWRKADAQKYLHDKTRKPVSLLRTGGIWGRELGRNRWPAWIDRADETSLVPLVHKPSDIRILVAGGTGAGSSLFIPGWGTRCVTRSVTRWLG